MRGKQDVKKKAEIWKAVIGYERSYEVSNLGRVRNCYWHNKPKIKKSLRRPDGYRSVILYGKRNGKSKAFYVHRPVLEAFSGKESRPHTRHLNNKRHDNRLSNLAWGDARENARDRLLSRGGKKLTLDDVIRIRECSMAGFSNVQLASVNGVTKQHISDIIRKKAWNKSIKNCRSINLSPS